MSLSRRISTFLVFIMLPVLAMAKIPDPKWSGLSGRVSKPTVEVFCSTSEECMETFDSETLDELSRNRLSNTDVAIWPLVAGALSIGAVGAVGCVFGYVAGEATSELDLNFDGQREVSTGEKWTITGLGMFGAAKVLPHPALIFSVPGAVSVGLFGFSTKECVEHGPWLEERVKGYFK